jgi:1-deoxy-D-xylulose-5-phosphate reductoisomerase
MRRVTVLGATGSIGQNTLDLIGRAPPGSFRVVALTGGRNVMKLAADARRLGAEVAVTAHEDSLESLQDALAGSGIEAAAGAQAICEAAARPVDWAMSAIVGAAGLAPGLAVLGQGATLALANKESLVTAGPLVLETARRHGARLLPVDSEHSAVFQALGEESLDSVERIIITASGGPFRGWTTEQMRDVTVAQASRHPNWQMGQRITIDSASLFNKALEIIETHEYFGIAPEKIEVLVHPESLVHALVGHVDGGLIAHVGPPDMRHAIGFALNWPHRRPLPVERLDLAAVGRLTFESADETRFPALRLAREVMAEGGLSGAAFNAAKEAALDGFLTGRVGFTGMADVVERTLDRLSVAGGLGNVPITLDNVQRTDAEARALAMRMMEES